MPTCDSQIHLFPPGSEERAARFGQRVVPLQEILAEMDGAGIDRAILVPTREDQVPLSVAAVERHPDRFRVAVSVRADNPQEARAVLRTLPTATIIAVRVTFPPWQKPSALLTSAADWLWPALIERGLPVMAWAPRLVPALGPVAERHPDLRLIVDHMGLWVDDRDDQLDPVLDELCKLAEHPNVTVKASGLQCATTEPHPYPHLLQRFARVVGAFGADRVFWGSDLTRLPGTYRDSVTMISEHADFLDERERALVLGDALLRCLHWT